MSVITKSRASEKVDLALLNKVNQILAISHEVVLRDVARELVDELREDDPEALLTYFENQAIAIFREKIQMRLMMLRNVSLRKGVFNDSDLDTDPFQQRFAVEDNIWRPLGEMTKLDWQYLIKDRGKRVQSSLFDIQLAKKLLERLPDDKTPTKEVISRKSLRVLFTSAEREAEKILNQLTS